MSSNFIFRRALPSDFKLISNHLKESYLRNGNLYKLAGAGSPSDDKKSAEILDEKLSKALEHDLSLLALEEKTQKVAGVHLLLDTSKTSNLWNLQVTEYPSFRVSKIKDLVIKLAIENGTFTDPEGVLEVTPPAYKDALGFVASVAPEFQRQGLCTKMYKITSDSLRSSGFKVLRGFFSSPFTLKIAQDLGYKELSSLYLSDVKDAEGKPLFPKAERNPGHKWSFMELRL